MITTLPARLARLIDEHPLMRAGPLPAVLLLAIWSTVTALWHGHSLEAPISASRLALETLLVLCAISCRWLNLGSIFRTVIISLGVINSLVVIIQLYEGAGCLPTNLNWLITDFWKLPVNEWTRKPGLFNGVLTSSFISFMTLAMLAGRKDLRALAIMSLCLFPILFGARTFLVFLPVFLLFYWRVLVGGLLLLGLFALLGQACGIGTILDSHFHNRLVLTTMVVVNADPGLDYSTHDLVSHYKRPATSGNWLLGNGQPRYSGSGGMDPAISRWLLQTGIPGLLLVLFISGQICWRILRKGGPANTIFAIALGVSLIKAELVTATLLYSILLYYALLPVPAGQAHTVPSCSSKPSPT